MRRLQKVHAEKQLKFICITIQTNNSIRKADFLSILRMLTSKYDMQFYLY